MGAGQSLWNTRGGSPDTGCFRCVQYFAPFLVHDFSIRPNDQQNRNEHEYDSTLGTRVLLLQESECSSTFQAADSRERVRLELRSGSVSQSVSKVKVVARPKGAMELFAFVQKSTFRWCHGSPLVI